MHVVTMRIGEELMAVPTGCLREILEPVAVTRVPLAGPFSNGLINVRGAVVPLADLRVAFRMAPTAPTADTRLVVIDVVVAGETITAAVIADRVHEVVEIDPQSLEALPGVGHGWPPGFVRGVGRWQARFLLVPDLEAVFSQAIAPAEPSAAAPTIRGGPCA